MTLREVIRSIRGPKIDLPDFDPGAVPDDPLELFTGWLTAAVEGGAAQPNAAVLSTASGAGSPSARTLLLKDVDGTGFWFSSLADSGKGRDIAENPRAALTLYWPEQSRQVRVAGAVVRGPRSVAADDFRSRHPNARARAIAGEQSEPMPGDDTADSLLAAAAARVDADPDLVADGWTAYVLDPAAIEFWQAMPDHGEARVRYRREHGAWVHERLWP